MPESAARSRAALAPPPVQIGHLAQPITALPAETPLVAALAHLATAPAGAVLVEAGGESVGILTERTAIELTLGGLQYERLLGEVCSHTLLWADAAESYVEVYERMMARGVRHALVRGNDGRIAGVLSETLILKRMGIEHFAHLDALEQIMTPRPITLAASASAHDALRAMRESRIGCIIVADDDGRPAGVITTRDATGLLARQAALEATPLATIMSRPVIHLEADRPVIEAARLMTGQHIRHIVVTRQGRVAGILSEHDIVRCLEHRYVDVLRHLIERQADEIEAHRQLSAQGNLLDQLLSRTHELGLCQIEATGRIRFSNPAAHELLGLGADACLAERAQIGALVEATDRPRFDALFGPTPPTTAVTLAIGPRAVLVRAYRMGDDTLLILVDEAVAAEAGEWLGFSRHALGTMSLPMVWADTSGRIAMRNRAFDQLIGSAGDAPPTDDLRWLLADAPGIIDPCHRHDDAMRTTTTLRRVDGAPVPVELFFSHMQFRGDHYIGGFIHDLSHHKRVEHALHDTEQQLGALLDTSPDFIAVKDPHNRWQIANAAGLRMYGLENTHWQGQTNETLARMASPPVAEVLRRCSDTDRLAWARGEPVRFIEVLPLVSGEGMRHLDMLKTPLFDDDGRPKALMVVGRDITATRATTEALERLRAGLEERVSQRTAELEAALTELESFSYSLSHDLRAPLRAIAGFSRLLSSDMAASLPPQGHDYLSRIRSAVARMDALIDDMLDLARLSRKPLHRETVNLSHMARRVAEELDERAPEREVGWDIEEGMTASADPLLLHSVLDNLLGNAWKFTQPVATPRIRLYTRRRENQTQFVVEDNGAGFDMSYADKLFQPFARLHSPREFEGSGIGLATVQRIITRHGGDIEGESPAHGGAVFRFTLGG